MSEAKRTPFNVRCGGCNHVWPAAYLPMETSLFAKLTKGIHCPNCGKGPKNIFVAPKPKPHIQERTFR